MKNGPMSLTGCLPHGLWWCKEQAEMTCAKLGLHPSPAVGHRDLHLDRLNTCHANFNPCSTVFTHSSCQWHLLPLLLLSLFLRSMVLHGSRSHSHSHSHSCQPETQRPAATSGLSTECHTSSTTATCTEWANGSSTSGEKQRAACAEVSVRVCVCVYMCNFGYARAVLLKH